MDLTEEQRRRMEENRARAQARLREKRARQSPPSSAAEEARESADRGRTPVDVSGGEADDAPRPGEGEPSSGHREDPDPHNDRDRGPARPSGAAEAGRIGETPSPRSTSTRAGGGRGGRSGSGRGGDGRGSGTQAAAAAAAVACEGCAGAEGDERVDKELLEGFGITVCRACKLKNEDFQCVTKKEAKDTYLLPEGTIAVLKFIERDNPRHSSWTKSRLCRSPR
eukprot:g2366.t2